MTAQSCDPLHTLRALERGDLIFEDQLRPVIAVDILDYPADLLAYDPAQRHRVPIHDRYFHARLPEGGCHLRADKPHPHHHRLPTRGDLCADLVGVSNCAQAIDALQVNSWDRDAPVASPGGDKQRLVGHAFSVVELDQLLGGIYVGDPYPESGFDVVLAVEVEWLEESLLERRFAAQVLTRERRPLVRRLGLRPDQDHPPVEALLAEGRCSPSTRETGADDYERFGHQPSTSRVPPSTRVS